MGSYIKYCMVRCLLIQLRLGVLELYLETGHFRNKQVQDRTCLICVSRNIENEEHFMCMYQI